MTQPHSKDDVLRMAEELRILSALDDIHGMPGLISRLKKAATMLRACAEAVRVVEPSNGVADLFSQGILCAHMYESDEQKRTYACGYKDGVAVARAEVVEVDAAMINRAREAYRIRLNQHVAASFDGDALQDAMRAALTAALSTRGG